jgi:hypothetical protein
MEPTPPSRFIVGIDLGTTNCAMAFVDSEAAEARVEVFRIGQWVDWQTAEASPTLPSFHYQWTDQEARELKTGRASPWVESDYAVGILARERHTLDSSRSLGSAKSWLCHPGVDRTAPILPWQADADVQRISPVEASSRYLLHMRRAWDRVHPDHPLAECDVIITLPASFDEVARELTIEAARQAGLPRIVLIEEPQAAFYAWLSRHEKDWQTKIRPGQTILICDIGGGTTDFTLIRVREANTESEYGLHRVAVGKHLLLGGDNFDVALAKAVETDLLTSEATFAPDADDPSSPPTLTHRQWESLRGQCRQAKEQLLGEEGLPTYHLTVAGAGSRLLGKTLSRTLTRSRVQQVLIEGFFPQVPLSDRVQHSPTGLFEFGLPYESDPAITRHLAEFLWDHRWAGRSEEEAASLTDLQAARPDWLLFNGGVLESSLIQQRLLDVVRGWFAPSVEAGLASAIQVSPIDVLDGERLDLAVAVGAAYFGRARRGDGVRIDARLARAYYLQVRRDPPQAMCVMPGDAAPLDLHVLDQHPFELEVGMPVQFPILVSSTRLIDRAGEVVDIDPTVMSRLPPIQTVIETLRGRRHERRQIFLESQLTEIGTLDLSLVEANSATASSPRQRWRLAFDLRSTVETDRMAHDGSLEQSGIVASALVDTARAALEAAFATGSSTELARGLPRKLAEVLGEPKHRWKPSLLRGMWQVLIELNEDCQRTPALEGRWLHLLGYCLRPGYGYAADDWRVQATWRRIHGKLKHASNANEAMVLWRRLAGGFTAGQQRALWQELQAPFRQTLEASPRGGNVGQEKTEIIRLIGSLEHLPLRSKQELGEAAIAQLSKKKLTTFHDSLAWLVGRVGARVLVYGSMSSLVSADIVESWLARLCDNAVPTPAVSLCLMQLGRRTGDRFRDISPAMRERVLETLKAWQAPPRYLDLVRQVQALEDAERQAIVGDELPLGIQILPGT